MAKVECKELGMDCDYVAYGNTVEDVKKAAMNHAQLVHGDLLKTMSAQQLADIDTLLTSKIK